MLSHRVDFTVDGRAQTATVKAPSPALAHAIIEGRHPTAHIDRIMPELTATQIAEATRFFTRRFA